MIVRQSLVVMSVDTQINFAKKKARKVFILERAKGEVVAVIQRLPWLFC